MKIKMNKKEIDTMKKVFYFTKKSKHVLIILVVENNG